MRVRLAKSKLCVHETARLHVRVSAAQRRRDGGGPRDTASAKIPIVNANDFMRASQTAPATSPETETNGTGSPGPASTADSAEPAKPMKRAKRRTARMHTELQESPMLMVTKPLPRVLILHTGGTLGMDPSLSYEAKDEGLHLKPGTGGVYAGTPPSPGAVPARSSPHPRPVPRSPAGTPMHAPPTPRPAMQGSRARRGCGRACC